MTVYDGEATVRRAVESLCAGNERLAEVVVVDDGSGDDTVEVLERMTDERIRILTPGRLGRAAALKYAAEQAQSPYVANLDADDESLPGRLDKQAAFLDAHPEIVWIGGVEEMIDERRGERFVRRYPADDAAIRRQSAKSIPYSHSAVMFRRSLLEEGLNYDPAQPYLIDFEFFIRVASRHKVANLAEPLVRRHVRGESYFQSRYSTARQNRRLARLCARAVRRFRLPTYYYLYPLARLGYPLLPDRIKRRVRRVQGLSETHV